MFRAQHIRVRGAAKSRHLASGVRAKPALSSSLGGTSVGSNASLLVGAGVTIAEPLTASVANSSIVIEGGANASGPINLGSQLSGGAGSVVSGPVTLVRAGAQIANLSSTSTFTISGAISASVVTYGPQFITSSSTAVIELTNPANNYSGVTRITGVGTVLLGAASAIPDASAVNIVDATASLQLNNFSETIGSLEGTGKVLMVLAHSRSDRIILQPLMRESLAGPMGRSPNKAQERSRSAARIRTAGQRQSAAAR
ncbi:MAG: hypothetical protein WKF77_00885 [Planctomycetaceae bacterium]